MRMSRGQRRLQFCQGLRDCRRLAARVSLPGCLEIVSITAQRPLTAASPRLICCPSTMRATWPSKIGRSADGLTTTCYSSLMSLIRPSERTNSSLPPSSR